MPCDLRHLASFSREQELPDSSVRTHLFWNWSLPVMQSLLYLFPCLHLQPFQFCLQSTSPFSHHFFPATSAHQPHKHDALQGILWHVWACIFRKAFGKKIDSALIGNKSRTLDLTCLTCYRQFYLVEGNLPEYIMANTFTSTPSSGSQTQRPIASGCYCWMGRMVSNLDDGAENGFRLSKGRW